MHSIGFTGTSHGMTVAQSEAFAELLETIDSDQFHHGDCIGADVEASLCIVEGERKKRCSAFSVGLFAFGVPMGRDFSRITAR